MFTFKPKKVFDKLNKMDRKQAYTIGAIAVVTIVALLMLVSAVSTNDDSFEGMAARGYDLANMPFATDAAEQYLLAAKYPDMKENGSTLLYSAAQKEARQEEDAQAAEEENASADETVSEYEANTAAARSDNGGYGGYSGGGYGGRRGSRGKTEIGQLGTANMAHSGGSGVSSTYGPTGDFRQFKGREDRGNGAPQQLVIDRNKEAAAFRTASMQAARAKGNQITAQRKAVQQLSVTGENPTTTGPTIDPTGGFQIDDGALPSTTDLDNLDKAVDDAAKKAQDKKDPPKDELGFWEKLGQDLLRQAATSLVSSIMDGVGDTVKGAINGNSASRAARNEYGASMAGKAWNADGKCSGNCLTQQQTQELMKNNVTKDTWENASVKQQKKMGRKTASAWAEAAEAKEVSIGKADGSSSARRAEQQNTGDPCKNVNCGDDYKATVVGNTCTCKKKNK